jgi:KDO2-lipid IV(A) lauroyltransferase
MHAKSEFWSSKLAIVRYAIVSLTFLGMKALILLPFDWQLTLGKAVGRQARRLIPSRRHVVERNLSVCFPELSVAERADLEIRHFEAVGASVVEMAMGWYGKLDSIQERVTIEGAEHLATALEAGKGVILYSAHFTAFEFFFPVLTLLCPRLCGMYKLQRNPLMNKVMNKGRLRSFDHLVSKDGVRDMLRELARNSVVWYAADQSYGSKGSALVPFFDEPAMTNTAISRIVRTSGAAVLPYFCRRTEESRYVATIYPPLSDFPSDDPIADTLRFTRLLESYIRQCPEQYWWIHQRFKGRPPEYPDIYDSIASS